MNIPQLKIGNLTAAIPIVQGGMGVRVSLSSLASAVANEGGIGTISSIGLGDVEASKNEYERISREALVKEIKRAKTLTNGHLAVNFMGVLSNADDLVRAAVQEGIRIIVYGAGLPMKLPDVAPDPNVSLVPIISSPRVADLILRVWNKRFNRIPDAFVLEGPLAGGHLGFSEEQLAKLDEFSLEKLLPEVLKTIHPYEDKYGKKIPVIAAGGIYDGRDIARMLGLGASGVQMATRFVCTDECDVSMNFKQAYLDAKEENIVNYLKARSACRDAPSGTSFSRTSRSRKRLKINCSYKCLTMCKIDKAKYCIALALVNSYRGDTDSGLIFCGQNAYRVDKITTVHELILELLGELREALADVPG